MNLNKKPIIIIFFFEHSTLKNIFTLLLHRARVRERCLRSILGYERFSRNSVLMFSSRSSELTHKR